MFDNFTYKTAASKKFEMDEVNKICEKFAMASLMLNNYGHLSPKTEPYKTKYKVIGMLKDLETQILKVMESKKEDVLIKMLAVNHLKIGLLHTDTEELKAGEERFVKTIELLEDKSADPEAVLPLISAYNQLGIIWSQWGQPEKSQSFLEKAEKIYNDYVGNQDGFKDPVHMSEIFGFTDTSDEETDPKTVLEKVHTLTLYYLAQVYRILKNDRKSAVYCYMTLRRQLGKTDIAQDLDYVEWALNAATLSLYFTEKNNFPQARHYLAAASCILQKYEDTLKKKHEGAVESEAATADLENLKHRSADVARCWAKYGITLLTSSKERLMKKAENEAGSATVEPTTVADLKFEVLEKDIEPIAKQVTDKYLLDFADARSVFLNVQKWLDQAKTYYTLESHASDYVLIVQDMSQAYQYLVFFEEDEDRQAKMHKRRIDILENVVKELNPQYYKTICRQLWVELAGAYSDILDIKVDRLQASSEKPTVHALAKIDHLAKSAIKNAQMFLNSLENQKAIQDMDRAHLPEDVEEAVLSFKFQIGRLYNKIITSDKRQQLENVRNSINAFRYVADYCEKYPKAAETRRVELNLCQELLHLLCVKENQIKAELSV